MKKFNLIITLSILVSQLLAIVPENEGSKWRYSLNGTWQFILENETSPLSLNELLKPGFKNANWEPIEVPGNWEMQGYPDLGYGGGVIDKTGWYKYEFSIPEHWGKTNRQVEIVFEGVASGYDLWVNGQHVGGFESAYNRSYHNIAGEINPDGKNELLVKVYNHHAHSAFDQSDSWSFCGIFRDVYLCATPVVHFDEYRITTKLKEENDAIVDIAIDIYSFYEDFLPLEDLKVEAELNYGNETIISEIKQVAWPGNDINKQNKAMRMMPDNVGFSFTVKNAELWNAETPNLYQLSLKLYQGNNLLQTAQKNIGIREISIENGQLLLNGKPVKLRGINRHEMHPEKGRALTRENWIKDLELIQAANINTIRTSHYPPHPKFIELCDQYGMYVIDEVPNGYGDYLLRQPQSLGIMLERVQNTIDRDRNSPSVIMWTIGNENPTSRYLIKAGEFAKMLDPSRPIGYAGNNFGTRLYGIPADVDVFCKHYPDSRLVEEIENSDAINGPVIFTEYNHALDNALDELEYRWNIIQNSKKIAGGCIWDWVDQEVMRVVPKGERVYDPRKEIETYNDQRNYRVNRWINDSTILDTHGADGNDGIVDGYRNPSPSYFEVKKVYAPVKVAENEVDIANNKPVEITIKNDFDFINLEQIDCAFQLISNNELITTGKLDLSAEPGEILKVVVPFPRNKVKKGTVNYLAIKFIHSNERHINTQHVKLISGKDTDNTGLLGEPMDTVFHFSKGKNELPSSLKINDEIKIEFTENGSFTISQLGNIIATGPLLHTNRKLGNTDIFLIYRNKERGGAHRPFFMESHMKSTDILSAGITESGDSKSVSLEYKFTIGENKGDVKMNLLMDINENTNYIDFRYQLIGEDIKVGFHELGLGLKVPAAYGNFSWLGDGPHIAYPGQYSLNEFGYYAKTINDRYFEGNYKNIVSALLTNSKKSGVAWLGNAMDVGLEKLQSDIILSHNVYVANRARKMKDSDLSHLENPLTGAFRLVLFDKGRLPDIIGAALKSY
jgi:beta-galactosidase